MDTILSAFHIALEVLSSAQACAQYLEATGNTREKIQASTQSMIDNLQKLAKDIGRLDGSHPDGILDDIGVQLKSFQTDVQNVRSQLEDLNNPNTHRTASGRIDRILRRGKNPKRTQALWEKVESLHRSESVLLNHISTRLQAHSEAERLRKDLIEWLKPFDYHSKHQSSAQLRQGNTCGWLLEDIRFMDWRSGSGSNFFWLYGIPGSGKTILFSKVIDDLENTPDITVAYHYCDFMNADSTVPSTILRSIFVQLLRRAKIDWLEEFKDLSSMKNAGKNPPIEVKALVELIQRASELHSQTVIAIDALDECQQTTANLEALLDSVKLLRARGLSLFVTTRDEQNFHDSFEFSSSVSLDGRNTSIDIDVFVRTELKAHRRFRHLKDIKRDEIVHTIVERAHGMFQMARCLIDVIGNIRSKNEIALLETVLPESLNNTYERLLENIDKKEKNQPNPGIAQRILMWLVGATRPLHILELYEAVMIEPGSKKLNEDFRMMDPADLLLACGSLVQSYSNSNSSSEVDLVDAVLADNPVGALSLDKDIIEKYRSTYVRLSHYTVKEYLQNIEVVDTRLSAYRLPPAIANRDIAIRILAYLSLNSFDSFGSEMWDRYRIRYGKDFRKNLSRSIGEPGIGMFFPYALDDWESHLLHDKESESHNLYTHLKQFFKTRFGQLCKNPAVMWGPTIKEGIENENLYALLLFAIAKSLVWVVKRILHDHPEMGRFNPCESTTPLLVGVQNRNRGKDVIRILLEAGARIESADEGLRILHPAAYRGDLEVLAMLIQAGADPKTVDKWGSAALHSAASGGRAEVLAMLIQVGADPKIVDKKGRTPLRNAVTEGHPEAIAILIQAGVDPKIVDKNGRTALHDAASRGHLKILTMLIQAGVDPNVVDQDGRTSLHDAASGGFQDISTVLLQAGVDPNAVDKKGNNALHDAASRGHLEVLKVLIQASADPLCRNKSGNTPLDIAINIRSHPMVECLLSAGASLEALGPIYDEQVEWAKGMPWYSRLVLRSLDYSSPSSERVDVVSARAVLEVRWMLYQILRLPSEIVSRILDLSEYWAHSFVLQTDRRDVVLGGNPFISDDELEDDIVYLSIKLDNKAPGSLRKLIFTTKSHETCEYGSSGRELVYDSCNSRFEVAVTPAPSQTFPITRPALQYRLIQHNVRNSLVNRIHVNTWEYENHTEWMDQVHPGDQIAVHVIGHWWAKNVVEFVRMDIYCAR